MALPNQVPSVCPGTGGLVHEGRTDGNGVTECPCCRRFACSTPVEGDEVYRTIDTHPARHPALTTHPREAVL